MFKFRHVLGALAALALAVAPVATAQTPDGVFGPGGSRLGREDGGRWRERGMHGRWQQRDGAWRRDWRGTRFESSSRRWGMRERAMDHQRFRAHRFEQRRHDQWNRQRMHQRMQERQRAWRRDGGRHEQRQHGRRPGRREVI